MPEPLKTHLDATWMRRALHDLSQPLCALECRLVIGTLESQEAETPEAARALRAAVEDALIQCARMMAQIHALQTSLRQEI